MDNHLEDMVGDIGEENFGRAPFCDTLKFDSEEQLYPRCNNFTW